MSTEILLILILWFTTDAMLNCTLIFPNIFPNFDLQRWVSFAIYSLRCLVSSLISSVKNIYDSFVKD
jgi:hypothetical protein